MKEFTAISAKGKNDVHFQAENETEARHWVINHLDLSDEWSVFYIKQ